MSEQMDFNDGKYTVIHDDSGFRALRYGGPWRNLNGDHLVYSMLVEAIRLKEERDALAEWKRQAEWIDEPFKAEALAEYGFAALTPREFAKSILEQQRRRQQAEPVNARLVEALENCVAFIEDAHILEAQWHWEPIKQAQDALAAAEAQQAEPVRLTRESVARAIWSVRREHEDRCDLELEDMQDIHPVWREADAVLAVTELAQSKPALMTIEQATDAERYAYLRSQHEGSVAASFAVFAPEQPIGEFGPVGSMPGELDAAIDAAMRANGYKVEG